MKLDMGRAWNDALAMLGANKDVIGILAAVFFFLPALIVSIIAPTTEIEAAAAANPDAAQAAFSAYFAENWALFLAYLFATFVGTLAIMALIGKRHRPTVGEAIGAAMKALIPYVIASLILGLFAGLLIVLAGGIGGVTGSTAIAAALIFVAIIFLMFVTFRVILLGPVMMVEGIMNPIAALTRSWNLVKGNTRRVFLFILMLGVALVVVSLVLGLIFGLIAAVFSGTVGLWIEAILGGVMGAVMSVIMLTVYVAIYKQLAGDVSPTDIETFE